MIYYISIHH